MKNDSISYTALGLMSGTSLDGLDIALCKFTCFKQKWSFELLEQEFIPYDKELLSLLKSAYLGSAQNLLNCDVVFGRFLGEVSRRFIAKYSVNVDLIASHGHTVFHAPQNNYTCQIGSGAEIAAVTKILTINNFRVLDVARRGQGAPLVPVGDMLLFSEYDACVNIGGFANISYDRNGRRIAYDICPVNIVLNKLASQLGLGYDRGGELANSGDKLEDLLNVLEQLPYYSEEPPKSLGQEWVEANIIPLLQHSGNVKDLLRTMTEHSALRIAATLEHVSGEKILLTGGGAKNKFLVDLIKTNTSKEVLVPSDSIIDMKEAIVFAFLGVLRKRGEVNCLSSVTGAYSDSVGGVEHWPL